MELPTTDSCERIGIPNIKLRSAWGSLGIPKGTARVSLQIPRLGSTKESIPFEIRSGLLVYANLEP